MSDTGDEFLSRFAANLTRSMESRGRSTAEIAELSGLRQSRIEQLLTTEAEPGALEIMRLAKALELTPGDLIDGISWDPDADA